MGHKLKIFAVFLETLDCFDNPAERHFHCFFLNEKEAQSYVDDLLMALRSDSEYTYVLQPVSSQDYIPE